MFLSLSFLLSPSLPLPTACAGPAACSGRTTLWSNPGFGTSSRHQKSAQPSLRRKGRTRASRESAIQVQAVHRNAGAIEIQSFIHSFSPFHFHIHVDKRLFMRDREQLLHLLHALL